MLFKSFKVLTRLIPFAIMLCTVTPAEGYLRKNKTPLNRGAVHFIGVQPN